MKNIALWGIMALCMGFAACDEVEDAAAGPQEYPGLPSFDPETLVVTTPEQQQTIVLQDAVENDADVAVATYTVTNFPFSEYSLEYTMEISSDESFSTYGEVPAVSDANGYVTVNSIDLQDAYYASISHAPEAREVYVRYAAYGVNGTSKVRLGGADKYYGYGKLTIKPCTPSETISENYYLIGTVSNDQVASAVKLSHSAQSPYDDPIFYTTVNITSDQAAAGWKWKIISEEAYQAGNLDVVGTVYGQESDGEDYTDGILMVNTASFNPGWGVVYEDGPHMVTVNMQTLEYTIELTIEQLYTPGNSNGWSQSASQTLTTSDYVNYSGFAYLNGEFKFTSTADWNGINYGNAGTDGELTTDGSAGNLNAATAGLYYCTVNIKELTYTITEITSLGVIGDFNGWGAQSALTPSADYLTWTGTVNFDANGGWKFRMNDNWDINLGGSLDNLTVNGDNLASPGAGAHTVTLNLASRPYTATVK